MTLGGLSEARNVRSDLLDRLITPRIEGGVLPAGLTHSMERIEAITRVTARGHLVGQIDPALLATILDLITSVMEQVRDVVRARIS